MYVYLRHSRLKEEMDHVHTVNSISDHIYDPMIFLQNIQLGIKAAKSLRFGVKHKMNADAHTFHVNNSNNNYRIINSKILLIPYIFTSGTVKEVGAGFMQVMSLLI